MKASPHSIRDHKYPSNPRFRQKTLDDLIAEACLKFETTPQALTASSRHRQVTRARAWIARQALTLRIASLAQIARTFERDESSLRKSISVHFNRHKPNTP